ncbi:MAG: PQQ-binding-like beta-propeller repeat protein, partial [bacterium]
GMLYSINSDGSLAWAYVTGGPVESSAAISTDTVYVGSEDGFLYVFAEMTPINTPTIAPTPTSTPTPTPIPPLVIDPGLLEPGEFFTLGITLHPDIAQQFDFYLFVESPAGFYTIYFNGTVSKGITPLYRNVPRFSAPFSATINSAVRVPPGMSGKTVTFYAVVLEAGRIPPVRKVQDITPETPYVIMMDKKTAMIGS